MLSKSKNKPSTIDANLAWTYRIIPAYENDDKVTFYSDSKDIEKSIKDLKIILDKDVSVIQKPVEFIQEKLAHNYRNPIVNFNKNHESINHFLEQVLNEAINNNASDIHIEPSEKHISIRYRIDGILIELKQIYFDTYRSLTNQIKIKSGLDISEKRRPQDGKFKYDFKQSFYDIRVSTLNTINGEKIVLRILKRDNQFELDRIGIEEQQLKILKSVLKKNSGLILISGPTGSGKTSTLYAILNELNKAEKNILTIEDPVEYSHSGINQVQVNTKIGFGFKEALRTFMRQDPDIIMVGEIRDLETAELAIRASLTGHLVLSSIHTNSAKESIERMMSMGIPDYLLNTSLLMSISQRLIRLLCSDCKTELTKDEKLIPEKFNQDSHFIPKGCENCNYSGYKGRKAIFEFFFPGSENEFDSSLQNEAIKLMNQGDSSYSEILPLLPY